jgi:RNA-directed DNA polymerase
MTTASERPEPLTAMLMEEVVRRENLLIALKRVRANKGSPGVDGMTVEELPDYLKQQWPRIREQLLCGDYIPQPSEAGCHTKVRRRDQRVRGARRT